VAEDGLNKAEGRRVAKRCIVTLDALKKRDYSL
jgi:hypothetical protein